MPSTNSVVAKALQQSLVDLIALELQGKQAHWNIKGPQFRSLHLALDEVVGVARTYLDEVAERLAALGGAPDGRPETVASTTVLERIDEGHLETGKTYVLMAEKVQQVSDSVQGFIEEVDEADPVTGDLLISVGQALDEQAWFLRSATE